MTVRSEGWCYLTIDFVSQFAHFFNRFGSKFLSFPFCSRSVEADLWIACRLWNTLRKKKESFRSFIVTVVCVDVMLSSLSSGQTDIPTVGCQILFLFVPLGLLSLLKKPLARQTVKCKYRILFLFSKKSHFKTLYFMYISPNSHRFAQAESLLREKFNGQLLETIWEVTILAVRNWIYYIIPVLLKKYRKCAHMQWGLLLNALRAI